MSFRVLEKVKWLGPQAEERVKYVQITSKNVKSTSYVSDGLAYQSILACFSSLLNYR